MQIAILQNEVLGDNNPNKRTTEAVLGDYFSNVPADVSAESAKNTELTPKSGATYNPAITVGEVVNGTTTAGGGGEGTEPADYSQDVKDALAITNNVSKYVTYNGITCRVLYDASSPYGIELIAANPVAEVTLGRNDEAEGAEGTKGTYDRAKWSYNNAISTLNKVADTYVVANDGIVEYARCVGSIPGSKEARETKNSAEANQYNYLVGKGLEGGEEEATYKANHNNKANYEIDETQLNALGIARISDTTNGSYYWLASRNVIAYSSNADFNVRLVSSDGGLSYSMLCSVASRFHHHARPFAWSPPSVPSSIWSQNSE